MRDLDEAIKIVAAGVLAVAGLGALLALTGAFALGLRAGRRG